MAEQKQNVTQEPPPWHAAYPDPKSTPGGISKEDLLKSMQQGATPGKDFLLVDLRRNDHEGGTIFGSINLPAQSLHPTIPTLYTLAKAAGVGRVIWYCGSSRGRGTRAAAWFADYLNDRGDSDVESVILEGGFSGWVGGGEEFVKYMHEADPSKWKRS